MRWVTGAPADADDEEASDEHGRRPERRCGATGAPGVAAIGRARDQR